MKKFHTLPFVCASLFLFIVALPAASMSEVFLNPIFEADKKNQISVHSGISLRHYNKFEELYILGFYYSQPNEFFRLPGRRNVEFITQFGIGELYMYNQDLIFGFSQDVMTPAVYGVYAGYNLGLYYKSYMTDRINSRFTFGQRMFLGFRATDKLTFEIFRQHFSNGNLTEKNGAQNFIGLSVMRAF